jgi:hypothetical protein
MGELSLSAILDNKIYDLEEKSSDNTIRKAKIIFYLTAIRLN